MDRELCDDQINDVRISKLYDVLIMWLDLIVDFDIRMTELRCLLTSVAVLEVIIDIIHVVYHLTIPTLALAG